MGASQTTPIILLILFALTVQTYAVTALLAAATNNCSYAFYSRAKTFTHKSLTGNPNFQTCEWRITVASDEKIILNITDMFIPKSPNCTQGGVEIRDGYWYSSPLLGRFCGGGDSSRTYTKSVLSTSNKLMISYKNLNVGIDQGFVASYEGICGGTFFVKNATTFSSPNYPGSYPLGKKCLWRIVVPDDYVVALSFTSFSLEYQSDCLYDYVEVREGPSLNGKIIGTYCNAKLPPSSIVANSSEIFVKFVSDFSLPLQGFEAVVRKNVDACAENIHGCAQLCINTLNGYKCDCRPGWQLHSNGRWCEVACGGDLTASSGTIQSPSYPYVYPVNRSCVWNIKTLYESKITVNFQQFSLENGFTNGSYSECNKDWLKLSHDSRENPLSRPSRYCQGGNEVAKHEETYCGTTQIDPIVAEGNELTISFNSDATIQKNGFLLNYTTELEGCLINNGNCHHGCVNNNGSSICVCPNNYTLQANSRDCTNDNCLFKISSFSGVINSPNYPNNNYPINKLCEWKFKTTPGHRFNITFLSFQLENHTTCVYDNVILYDGSSNTSNSLGKFCGSGLPKQLNSSTNELYAMFKSDGSNVFKGFQATYNTVCGGNLTADSTEKYIYSHPNFGYSNYDNMVFCEWTIRAPPGKTITVAFLSFFLETGVCNFDYVEILNQKYCGLEKPSRICSTNNVLVILFKTDGSIVNRGFSLVYKATD